jgi:phenylacetate-CoA ligase
VRDLPGIARFRIVQHDLAHTEVELVPGEGYRTEYEERIRAQFQARLGADVTVTIRRVEAIAPRRRAKHRYVVSRVDPAAAAQGEVARA